MFEGQRKRIPAFLWRFLHLDAADWPVCVFQKAYGLFEPMESWKGHGDTGQLRLQAADSKFRASGKMENYHAVTSCLHQTLACGWGSLTRARVIQKHSHPLLSVLTCSITEQLHKKASKDGEAAGTSAKQSVNQSANGLFSSTGGK